MGRRPPPTAKRSLAAASDPMRAQVPERWRSSRYGHGMRWRCRWYTIEGTTRRQHSKSFAKLTDAEAYKAAMEDDVRRGRYTNPADSQRKFKDVAEIWLRSKNNVSEGVRARYECELRVYVNPKWSDVPIGAISMDDVSQWVAELTTGDYPVDLRREHKPKPLSPRSVKSIVKVVFTGVLDYAVKVKYLIENPARDVEISKTEYRDLVFLNIHEIEALADAAETVGRPVDALIIRFQSYVGTRINEAFALQVGDLDLKNRKARIRRIWKNSATTQRLGPPKSGKPRTVAIPKFLIKPLKKQVEGQPDTAYVFRAVKGGHINDHNWRRTIWHPAVKHAHLQDVEGLTPAQSQTLVCGYNHQGRRRREDSPTPDGTLLREPDLGRIRIPIPRTSGTGRRSGRRRTNSGHRVQTCPEIIARARFPYDDSYAKSQPDVLRRKVPDDDRNNKVWRMPVACLASVAMVATVGVSAMTANATDTDEVILDVNYGVLSTKCPPRR